jgi:hypothetical protein
MDDRQWMVYRLSSTVYRPPRGITNEKRLENKIP